LILLQPSRFLAVGWHYGKASISRRAEDDGRKQARALSHSERERDSSRSRILSPFQDIRKDIRKGERVKILRIRFLTVSIAALLCRSARPVPFPSSASPSVFPQTNIGRGDGWQRAVPPSTVVDTKRQPCRCVESKRGVVKGERPHRWASGRCLLLPLPLQLKTLRY
jgi:hypothetical protein